MDKCRCGGSVNLYDGLLVCEKCGKIETPPPDMVRSPPRDSPKPKLPPPPPRLSPPPIPKPIQYTYNRSTITLSTEEKNEWLRLKQRGKYSWNGLMHMIRLEYLKLESLKEELKEANATLRDIALRQASTPQVITVSSTAGPTRPWVPPPPSEPIVSDPELLKEKSKRADMLRELKQKFVESENIFSILEPVSEEELANVHSRQVHQSIVNGKYTGS